jgi:hypothetical protein
MSRGGPPDAGDPAKPARSTDCSHKSFFFSNVVLRSQSSRWFIASRLSGVEMLKAGCGQDWPPHKIGHLQLRLEN